MKKRSTKLIGIVIALSIIGLFVYSLSRYIPYILDNVKLSIPLFAGLVLLGLLVFVCRAIMNYVVFTPLGVKLSIRHWVGIVVAGNLANTLPFSAGLIAKGYYLKRIHQLPYQIFAGGQIALFALVLCTNGIVGLVILLVVFYEEASAMAWALFALMACAGLVLVVPKTIQQLLGKKRFPWPEWTGRERMTAWLGAGFSQVIILTLLAAKLKLCFAMGLEPVSFFACMLFSASIAITRLISLTPASIGIREFMIGSVAYLVGFEFRDALIASTIDRVADLLIVGALSPFIGYYFNEKFVAVSEEDS